MSKQNTLEHLVNMQFEIAGYDTTELNYKYLVESKNNDWFTKNTISKVDQDKFEAYFKSYVKKHHKLSDKKVQTEWAWFHLAYGLKCVDNE